MNRVMKNLVLALSMVTAGTVAVGAQQAAVPPPTAVAPAAASGPKIQFATPMYDFGRVKSGDPVTYTYVFTNTGDNLLILNSVQPQCGCTAAGDWTKQVEPGKTGIIPIKFNTAGYNGPVFKQVTVTCNVMGQPTMFLQFKGSVFKPFDVIPPYAVLTVPPDTETASMLVTITNHTEEPLIILSAESNNRMFSAQLITNQLGKGYQVKLSIVPPLSRGSAQSQISLKTTWTNTPVIVVTAVANVQPAIMVIPSYVTLAPGPLPYAVTNSVMIQNNSTNRLELSEPAVNVPGVAAQIRETQPGKSFIALLAFPQGFQSPAGQQIELSVKSNNPRYPVVKVIVMQLQRPPTAVLPAPAPAAAPVVAPAPPVNQLPLVPPPSTPVRRVSSAVAQPPPMPPPRPSATR
jgi:Protein of unknown function (DUF1573)